MTGAHPSTVGDTLVEENDAVTGVAAGDDGDVFVQLRENPDGDAVLSAIMTASVHGYAVSYGRLETETPELALVPAERGDR